ncbi:MAG: glycoside hydrolase family 97 N-terminal domain-containing protein, partial [Flavobacterium sp.]|nr:glycoside hydrolase family 97 N-terminal domain-containing protein [Flavobacterium sp.]
MNFQSTKMLLRLSVSKKIALLLFVCASPLWIQAQVMTSPNKNLTFQFELTANGTPTYQLSFKGKPVVKTSTLGLEIKMLHRLWMVLASRIQHKNPLTILGILLWVR